jgi:hypothetical protein
MLGFIIVFTVIGLLLGLFLEKESSYIWIGIITVGWAFVMGPWAIATFIELAVGSVIGQGIKKA